MLLVLGLHGWKVAVPGGFIGVSLFFVLSGFLITTLLLREHERDGHISLRRFYARRALRLFPALAALLVVVLVLSATLLPGSMVAQTRSGLLWSLSYASNWVRALDPVQSNGAVGHTWSLSIEEQFYLVWPLLFMLLLRLPLRTAFFFGAALIALVWVWRLRLQGAGIPLERVYYGTDTRADLLLAGCLVGVADALGWLRAIPWSLLQLAALAGFTYVLVFALRAPFTPVPGTWNDYPVETVMIAALLAATIAARPAWLIGVLRWQPIAALGAISYGVYLWHYPIWSMLSTRLPSGPMMLLILVSLTIGAAVLSYRFIEQPALRLKERLGGQPVPLVTVRGAASPPVATASRAVVSEGVAT